MIDFKPITLSDKNLINYYLNSQRNISSELCFTTLYIWRKALNIKYSIVNDCLVLMLKDNGYPASLRFPIGFGDKKAAAYSECRHFEEIGEAPKFYGLTEDMFLQFKSVFPDQFDIIEMDDYFDYVYSSEKLINLSGKKLHAKKNHVNTFKRLYNFEYSPIVKEDADFITSGYAGWFQTDDPYLKSEQQAITDLVINIDELDIFGGKIVVDGQLCAFTFGERLNDDTAIIHIEKADNNFKGSYSAINQMFAENCLSGFTFVNREEDLGIEGLRKAKESYHPDFFVKKYKAIIKKGASFK